jgi:hypothetical protein
VFATAPIRAGTVLEDAPVLVLTKEQWERGRMDDTILGEYGFCWANGGMALGLGIGESLRGEEARGRRGCAAGRVSPARISHAIARSGSPEAERLRWPARRVPAPGRGKDRSEGEGEGNEKETERRRPARPGSNSHMVLTPTLSSLLASRTHTNSGYFCPRPRPRRPRALATITSPITNHAHNARFSPAHDTARCIHTRPHPDHSVVV